MATFRNKARPAFQLLKENLPNVPNPLCAASPKYLSAALPQIFSGIEDDP
jgi:hypothetical protein